MSCRSSESSGPARPRKATRRLRGVALQRSHAETVGHLGGLRLGVSLGGKWRKPSASRRRRVAVDDLLPADGDLVQRGTEGAYQGGSADREPQGAALNVEGGIQTSDVRPFGPGFGYLAGEGPTGHRPHGLPRRPSAEYASPAPRTVPGRHRPVDRD